MMSPGSSWPDLRNQARGLENEIESKLLAFSKLGKSGSRRPGVGVNDSNSRFEGMAMELNQLLSRLNDINDRMHEVVGENPTPSLSHTLSRHTEILDDMKRDFMKTKQSIRATRDKAELLSSVQRDINSYHNAERQDLLMREHDHTMNSLRGAEDAISVAMAAKEALVKQRGVFGVVQSRMTVLAERFPAMKNLMNKISYRKNRDQVILAGVIASCIILSLMYTFR